LGALLAALLRKMELGDLRHVIRIIQEHDEDDGESAEKSYQDTGFDHQFVLECDENVVGVTGYKEIPSCDRSYWLSWTYLDQKYRGQGYGRQMVQELIDKLHASSARKLFVQMSDYEDADDGKIYEAALKLYQSVGFELEVTSEDFYDEGESQLILGLVLEKSDDKEIHIADEKACLEFSDLIELAETEGAYTFGWTTKEKKSLFSAKRNFTVLDLKIGLESVQENGGRAVFLTFPSNLPLIHEPLQKAGFRLIGQLTDYYEQGLHELHFCYRFNE
jgi:GNAT superfamily N-acetyltransferase